MTTTVSISGQTIGTGANAGENLFPQKVTRNAATTAFVLSLRLTNGVAEYDRHAEVRVWYSSSPYSVSAALGAVQLKQTARYVDIRPSNLAAGVMIKDSSLEPITGDFIYFWCDIPAVVVAQTLDVTLVELP